MKKLRIDLVSILVLALLIAGAVWLWGESIGIKTPEARSYWLSAVAVGTLVLAILASLDRVSRWWDALNGLRRWLGSRTSEMVGTTQASIVTVDGRTNVTLDPLVRFRQTGRQQYGLRWHYRQPWLLLTGDDHAIAKFLPDLAEPGWLITPDSLQFTRSATNPAMLPQTGVTARMRLRHIPSSCLARNDRSRTWLLISRCCRQKSPR